MMHQQQIDTLKDISETISTWIDGSPEMLGVDAAYSVVIQRLDEVISNLQYANTAMLDVVTHLHKDDNAVLIAIPHDLDSSITVEHGDNQLAPFKRHIRHMLDREYERIGYDADEGSLLIEPIIKDVINEWEEEYQS
jgi:hypothetical protein